MSRLRAGIIVNVVASLYKFSVNVEISKRNVFCSFYVISIFCDIVEVAVFHTDIGYMFVVIQTNDEYA